MPKIRITKEFGFESSHALKNYDGLCRNIHGHSYKLFVTVSGDIREERGHPKDGMVMDFGDLKNIVYQEIVIPYDHSLILNEEVSAEAKESYRKITERLIFTPFQPTCENLVRHFASLIKTHLPEHVRLVSVKLFETPSSSAEWCEEDNCC